MNPNYPKKKLARTHLSLREPTFAYPIRLYHQAWLERRITTAELALLCNPEALITIIRAHEAMLKREKQTQHQLSRTSTKETCKNALLLSLAAVGVVTMGTFGIVGLAVLEDSYHSPHHTLASRQIFLSYELVEAVRAEINQLYVPEWSALEPYEHISLFPDPEGVGVIASSAEIDIFGLRQVFISRGYTVTQTTSSSFVVTSKTIYE